MQQGFLSDRRAASSRSAVTRHPSSEELCMWPVENPKTKIHGLRRSLPPTLLGSSRPCIFAQI